MNKGVDRAANRAEQSIADVLPISNPGLRDFISMLLGWLLRFYVPGASMLTQAQHRDKVSVMAPK